jgi:hypothetical protein
MVTTRPASAWWAVFELTDTSTIEELVLLYLIRRAGPDGCGAFPSVPTIAKACKASDRAVQLALRKLQREGYISGTPSAGGRRRSTSYDVNVSRLRRIAQFGINGESVSPLKAGEGEGNSPFEPGNGEGDSPQGCNSFTDNGEAGSPDLVPRIVDQEEVHRRGAPAKSPAETEEPKDRPPFKVYAAIATKALERSLREDRDDSISNVTEHFKLACSRERLPYDGETTRKAVEAALCARDSKRREFNEKLGRLSLRDGGRCPGCGQQRGTAGAMCSECLAFAQGQQQAVAR